jgi:nitrogenase molybdenum-iron protein alpha/beta subunit
VLPGCHLTPGDIDELRQLIEAFGLDPTFVPDLSGSLDGHIPDSGWAPRWAARRWQRCRRWAARCTRWPSASRCGRRRWRLQARCGVPFTLFDRLTGLTATDALVKTGRAVGPAGAERASAASAASWSTPCSTATSTSATCASHWRPSPTCCGPPA